MKIEAGSLLVIETGEYSDYTFIGPFRVLKSFDQAEVAEAYRKEWVGEKMSHGGFTKPDEDGFTPWLFLKGYIEDVDGVVSWHIGSYGTFEPKIGD